MKPLYLVLLIALVAGIGSLSAQGIESVNPVHTEIPDGFKRSPLANYLSLNDGLGAEADGGIVLSSIE